MSSKILPGRIVADSSTQNVRLNQFHQFIFCTEYTNIFFLPFSLIVYVIKLLYFIISFVLLLCELRCNLMIRIRKYHVYHRQYHNQLNCIIGLDRPMHLHLRQLPRFAIYQDFRIIIKLFISLIQHISKLYGHNASGRHLVFRHSFHNNLNSNSTARLLLILAYQ